jgi:hypothetical protein
MCVTGMHRFLCTLSGLFLLAWGTAWAQSEPVSEIFRLDQVESGQTGFGLSVFRGTEPEKFDVEILGVWRNTAPNTSFILARLYGQGLEESGVVAGMSGSPVYIQDKLVGAVSFAWPFSLEPIAGITPIEAMQRLLHDSETGESPHAAAQQSLSLESLAALDFPKDLLLRRLALLSARPLSEASSGLVWSTFGFGKHTRELLTTGFGALSFAGKAESSSVSTLTPGGAVAAVLVGGDLQLAATGTLTSRSGPEVLAFGHPFLDIGSVQLPMATAEVVTVLSSQFSSFKIANLGREVGAIDLDRMTGIRGQIGRMAATTPMRVHVEGERIDTFEMKIARLPSLTPVLAAISMLGALEATTQAFGEQGLDVEIEFNLGPRGVLPVSQSFDGEGAGFEAATYVLALSDYLLNNRLESVEIESLDVRMIQHPQSRVASLVEAHATRTLVRPGDKVGLNLDFSAYRGSHWRQSLEVEIPTGIPDGRYSLLVGDGVSIDVARITLEQSVPVSFGQALEFLRRLHSRRDLVVLGVFGGAGLSVAGEVLPRLPDSIRSIWAAAASSSAIPLQLALAQQQELEMEVPVEGAVRIDLDIRRKGPLTPDESTAGGEQRAPQEGDDSQSGSGQPGQVGKSSEKGSKDG